MSGHFSDVSDQQIESVFERFNSVHFYLCSDFNKRDIVTMQKERKPYSKSKLILSWVTVALESLITAN